MLAKYKPTLIILTLFAMLLAACGAPATTAPAAATSSGAGGNAAVSFANNVLPLLQSRCLNCHGGQQTQRGFSVASYETVMAGSQNGPVIVPGDPNNSLLIQLVQSGRMPKRGPQLTANELQILIDWVNTGALNN